MPSTVMIGVAAVVVVVLAYWTYDEYQEADDAAETAAGVGMRTRSALESTARGTRIAVIGLAGLGATFAVELMQLGAGLNEIFGGIPVVVGHLIFGAVSLLGLSGVIPLDAQTAGFVFVFVTVVALIVRFGNNADTEGM